MIVLMALASIQWAPPPPIVLRNHWRPATFQESHRADCPVGLAEVLRDQATLRIAVGTESVALTDVQRVTELTPILEPSASISVECGSDSVLVRVQAGEDQYGLLFVGVKLEAVRKNNFRIP